MKEYKPEKPVSEPLQSTIASRASECPKCKEVFTSPSYFDKHLRRVSSRIDTYRMACQNPADIGMEIGSRGYWLLPQDETRFEKDN